MKLFQVWPILCFMSRLGGELPDEKPEVNNHTGGGPGR